MLIHFVVRLSREVAGVGRPRGRWSTLLRAGWDDRYDVLPFGVRRSTSTLVGTESHRLGGADDHEARHTRNPHVYDEERVHEKPCWFTRRAGRRFSWNSSTARDLGPLFWRIKALLQVRPQPAAERSLFSSVSFFREYFTVCNIVSSR